MVAGLNSLSLNSSFFADIICRDKALSNLKDGTLYVFTRQQTEWERMVNSVLYSIAKCQVKALWHMPFSIESLNDFSLINNDEALLEYLECESNFIMPLNTPDRDYKCYFVGNIPDPSKLHSAFSILTVDAQKIYNECSFAAFVNSIESNPESSKQLWFKLIDYNSYRVVGSHNISFRGKYKEAPSEFTFLGPGFEKKIENAKIGYAELIGVLNRFPEAISNLSGQANKELFKEDKMDYVRICNSLSAVAKNQLIFELSKRIDKNILIEAINAVINKNKSSKLKVRVIKRPKNYKYTTQIKEDNRRIHSTWCTYLEDENEVKQWLDFEPQAHIVYLMNLIQRVTKPEVLAPIDVKNNMALFVKLYNIVYEGDGEMQYKRLFYNIKKENGNGFLRKRLTDCYKIITNCINIRCSFYNESPSPYITDSDKPLTIDPCLIDIPEEFMRQLNK